MVPEYGWGRFSGNHQDGESGAPQANEGSDSACVGRGQHRKDGAHHQHTDYGCCLSSSTPKAHNSVSPWSFCLSTWAQGECLQVHLCIRKDWWNPCWFLQPDVVGLLLRALVLWAGEPALRQGLLLLGEPLQVSYPSHGPPPTRGVGPAHVKSLPLLLVSIWLLCFISLVTGFLL